MASTTEKQQQQDDATAPPSDQPPLAISSSAEQQGGKWPGWPGQNVFRLVVPVDKVGSIIGRKGELVKKMCEESGAKIRVLDAPFGTPHRIVLVFGKEDPGAEISPAMDAILRVVKRVNEISDTEGDAESVTALSTCPVRLLLVRVQSVSLIGKAGATIRSIQEESGCVVRVLPGEDLPFYGGSDERIVDIEGDSVKVLKALKLVLGHVRIYLVDQSVIPLFDKIRQTAPGSQTAPGTTAAQDCVGVTYEQQPPANPDSHSCLGEPELPSKSNFLLHDRKSQIDLELQRSRVSIYGQDPAASGLLSSGLGYSANAVITQMTQAMQIPLSYAEDIIGIGGANLEYIRRTSGAILSVQETRDHPDEVTVEIKGSPTQVETAQQLVQEFLAGHKEPAGSHYMNSDIGYRTQFGGSSYSSFSLTSQLYGRYGLYGAYGSSRY